MTPRATRDRMVDSAIALLRERGAAGVTVDAVLAHSGAPRGSVYHHFPGGRDELVLTAGRAAAAVITGFLTRTAADGDARAAVARIVEFWKKLLAADDHRAGCPVVAIAVNPRPDLPEADTLVREAFDRWESLLAETIAAGGVERAEAADLATLVLAAIEGALLLSRSRRSPAPLDTVARRLTALLP